MKSREVQGMNRRRFQGAERRGGVWFLAFCGCLYFLSEAEGSRVDCEIGNLIWF